MWLLYILAGLIGGICGGMGFGGGTLLIPILTLLLGIEQHLSQGLNLLVFIPTAVFALIIHAKNKLLNYKIFIIVIVPAIISAILCSFFVKDIEGDMLRKIFAIFLIVLACYELFVAVRASILYKKQFNTYKFII